jgi:hypothetical protein
LKEAGVWGDLNFGEWMVWWKILRKFGIEKMADGRNHERGFYGKLKLILAAMLLKKKKKKKMMRRTYSIYHDNCHYTE